MNILDECRLYRVFKRRGNDEDMGKIKSTLEWKEHYKRRFNLNTQMFNVEIS